MSQDKILQIPLDSGVIGNVLPEAIPPDRLQESRNNRLSIQMGTCQKAPAISPINTASTPGAIVPHGTSDTAVVYGSPQAFGAMKLIDGKAVFFEGIDGDPRQNAWWPTQISQAGALPGSFVATSPAVAVDANGLRWFASIRRSASAYAVAGSSAIFVTVLDRNGKIVINPVQMLTLTTNGATVPDRMAWLGLTSHGATGVMLWYLSGGAVYGTRLEINSSTGVLQRYPSTAIYTLPTNGLSPNTSSGQLIDISCTNQGQYAWLVTMDAASVSNFRLHRIQVTTLATTVLGTTSVATSLSSDCKLAVTHINLDGTDYVGVGVSRLANLSAYLFQGSSLTQNWGINWSSKASGVVNEVAIRFLRHNGVTHVIGVASGQGNLLSYTESYTRIGQFAFSNGALGGYYDVPNMRLASRGCDQKPNGDDVEVYPAVPLMPAYSTSTSDDPTSVNYVEDPSVEVYRIVRRGVPTVYGPLSLYKTHAAPIARYGVDRVRTTTIYGVNVVCVNSQNCVADGTTIVCTYTEQDRTAVSSDGFHARYVEIDTSVAQYIRPVYDVAGTAFLATSLAAGFDGNTTTEWAPLHKPKVIGRVGWATLIPTITADFWLTCVVMWKDATGLVHRSAPATPTRITASSQTAIFYAYLPYSLHDGLTSEGYIVIPYATLDANSGGVFYAQNQWIVNDLQSGSNAGFLATNSNLRIDITSVPTNTGATLYSTGGPYQPLVAEPPPPCWDACTAGNRLWVIDAERRNRVAFTKLKEPGIAYEFNANLEILFPVTHGKLVSIQEFQGNLLVLAERGLFLIYGQGGPDNTGAGFYSDPVLVSDIGCKNKESVIRTPVGIMFACTRNRFALFNGQVRVFDDMYCPAQFGDPYKVIGTALFPDASEAVFQSNGGQGQFVYNYLLDRWTTWEVDAGDSLESPINVFTQSPVSQKAIFHKLLGGKTYTMDPQSISTNPAVIKIWQTGWIVPNGLQGDIVLRRIIYQGQGQIPIDHGIKITLFRDYGEPSPDVREWSSYELEPLMDAEGHYTIAMDCPNHPMRAFLIAVQEERPLDVASGDGPRPVGLSVVYTDTGSPTKRNALKQGALK